MFRSFFLAGFEGSTGYNRHGQWFDQVVATGHDKTVDHDYQNLAELGIRGARETIRWAIEPIGHGEMIGTVGLLRFDFEQRRAEVGYELARHWWGRGLASEATAAVIGYGFLVLRLHRIEAGLLPGNDASVRVLQKLGFVEDLRPEELLDQALQPAAVADDAARLGDDLDLSFSTTATRPSWPRTASTACEWLS